MQSLAGAHEPALPAVRKERMVPGDTLTSAIRGQLRLVVLKLAAHLSRVENLEQMLRPSPYSRPANSEYWGVRAKC